MQVKNQQHEVTTRKSLSSCWGDAPVPAASRPPSFPPQLSILTFQARQWKLREVGSSLVAWLVGMETSPSGERGKEEPWMQEGTFPLQRLFLDNLVP